MVNINLVITQKIIYLPQFYNLYYLFLHKSILSNFSLKKRKKKKPKSMHSVGVNLNFNQSFITKETPHHLIKMIRQIKRERKGMEVKE
jgi:hypothetical protein